MATPASAPTPASTVADQLHAVRASWGWFVVLGIAFIVLGFVALAHVLASTVVTALYVGALILVGGVVQVIHAFRVKGWGRFFYWLLAGVLYVVAGGLIMSNPLLGAGILTLMIGVALAVEGIFRIFAGVGVPHMVTADMVKPGAAVVDVGVSRVDGKLTGDVAPDVWDVAGHVSPNPGGVGPLTRAFLLTNVVEAEESKLA